LKDAATAVSTPMEEIPLPIDKKSKKHRKEQKVTTNLADGTMSITTNEIETTIVDKKTMRKRVKHFLKKQKSASGTPMKPESKLSKIQKSMMGKHIHQYQSVPLIEEVRLLIFLYTFMMEKQHMLKGKLVMDDHLSVRFQDHDTNRKNFQIKPRKSAHPFRFLRYLFKQSRFVILYLIVFFLLADS